MPDDPIAILTSTRSTPDPARPHLWPLILIVLLLLSVAVGIFGSSESATPVPTVSGTPERQARIYTISYRFGVFSPTNLRIHAGDTVRFRNDSPLPIRIVAQLQPGQRTPEFDSIGEIAPDGYFSYTFAMAGIFGYNNYSDKDQAGIIIVR